MSRLLLNNSNAVLQRATATAATANVCSSSSNSMRTTSPVLSKHVARRWKSLLIHVNQQQNHRQLSKTTFSSAQTFKTRGSRIIGSNSYTTEYCRALSTSAVVNSSQDKMPGQANKILQLDNINPNFITMEYAVRGPLVIRAGEIERELKQVCTFATKQLFFQLFFRSLFVNNCVYQCLLNVHTYIHSKLRAYSYKIK